MNYPGIARAALEIAYDNGGINRCRSEEDHARELAAFLARKESSGADLHAIDAWLASRSPAELDTVCTGEESDMIAAMVGAPTGATELLNAVFDEVC